MKPPPETIVTDRLVLRRPALTDAPAIYEYGRDPEVTRYLVFRTHKSLADAEGFLGTCRARWESGEEYYWLITLRGQNRTLGSIACRLRGHAVDIGYALASVECTPKFCSGGELKLTARPGRLKPDFRGVPR